MTDDTLLPFDLPAVRRKKLTVDFEGGLPPLSAAERAAERERERELSVVLVEMFGPKGNYSNREIDAACAVLDAREGANG